MHPLHLLPLVRRHRNPIMDADALDDQHPILGLDLADRLDLVALRIDLDLTRLQRAGERAGQSPSGGSHHVIERRGVRRILLGTYSIVLSHLRVHTEDNRLRFGREVGEPLGAAQPFDPDPRYVCDLAHQADTTPLPLAEADPDKYFVASAAA